MICLYIYYKQQFLTHVSWIFTKDISSLMFIKTETFREMGKQCIPTDVLKSLLIRYSEVITCSFSAKSLLKKSLKYTKCTKSYKKYQIKKDMLNTNVLKEINQTCLKYLKNVISFFICIFIWMRFSFHLILLFLR